MRRGRLGWGWVEAGRGWLGGAGATERGFLLHWGGAKTKGLFFVLARRCRPLADMSPARVGFNAPSSKNSRLIFAQQPRPNGKRNPLLHVLRTAGTLPMIKLGPCCNREGVAGASVRHRRGGKGALRGRSAKRHHRKIRRLFLRETPAKSKRKPLYHVLRTAGTTGQFF